MTDIAARLRHTAAHFERVAKSSEEKSHAAGIAAEMREAADEIERLRAKLAEYERVPVRLRHIMATGKMPPDDMK